MKTILGSIGGIIASVITGVTIWWLTTEHPKKPPPGSDIGLFVGSWVNENSSTGGVTRVEVEQRLDHLYFHLWGRCHPVDCDNGIKEVGIAGINNATVSAKWTWPHAQESVQWSVLTDGRLRLVSRHHFLDRSGRPDYDSSDYFKKQK